MHGSRRPAGLFFTTLPICFALPRAAAPLPGETHREMPHIYGVSYFSSKGPTGDSREKPDLVSLVEKIISCASGWRSQDESAPDHSDAVAANTDRMNLLRTELARWQNGQPRVVGAATAPLVGRYKEDSDTSMAAPHVSGVIAPFLSVRREFIGRPEKVKEVFMTTATDLKRDQYLQGQGHVDLMRAIQSV